MGKFRGIIIEESLQDRTVLERARILYTKVEEVTEKSQTPWLSQWTLHMVEIEPEHVDNMAELLSRSLEREHDWYADFNDGENFYVIFTDRVFTYKKNDGKGRQEAVEYGQSLGIPDYQLDFP